VPASSTSSFTSHEKGKISGVSPLAPEEIQARRIPERSPNKDTITPETEGEESSAPFVGPALSNDGVIAQQRGIEQPDYQEEGWRTDYSERRGEIEEDYTQCIANAEDWAKNNDMTLPENQKIYAQLYQDCMDDKNALIEDLADEAAGNQKGA